MPYLVFTRKRVREATTHSHAVRTAVEMVSEDRLVAILDPDLKVTGFVRLPSGEVRATEVGLASYHMPFTEPFAVMVGEKFEGAQTLEIARQIARNHLSAQKPQAVIFRRGYVDIVDRPQFSQ